MRNGGVSDVIQAFDRGAIKIYSIELTVYTTFASINRRTVGLALVV